MWAHMSCSKMPVPLVSAVFLVFDLICLDAEVSTSVFWPFLPQMQWSCFFMCLYIVLILAAVRSTIFLVTYVFTATYSPLIIFTGNLKFCQTKDLKAGRASAMCILGSLSPVPKEASLHRMMILYHCSEKKIGKHPEPQKGEKINSKVPEHFGDVFIAIICSVAWWLQYDLGYDLALSKMGD